MLIKVFQKNQTNTNEFVDMCIHDALACVSVCMYFKPYFKGQNLRELDDKQASPVR